jgi:hypothetical protein
VITPLLFQNESSDVRDHCANERSYSRPFLPLEAPDADHLEAFLSYLRLSIYMAVVSVAIVLSFHLKHQPTEIELRMAKPLGAIFWCLAVACLLVGAGNYISEYGFRMATSTLSWLHEF